jgi:outer membrane protein OmpA-like peptidoglycan-associated protein
MDTPEHGSATHWIPLADLMTGLMMVFMLLTAAFMLRVEQTTTLVVNEWVTTKQDLERALQNEFSTDLKQWNAELLGDMTIRFKDPTGMFATGSAALRPKFQQDLRSFFPRYIALLTSPKFKDVVKEVRIEGHTSHLWQGTTDAQIAYFRNMELSQARTRSALEYLMSLPEVIKQRDWLVDRVTANGLSSSKPIRGKDGKLESDLAQQRVEFRIVTNATERMEQIAGDLTEK